MVIVIFGREYLILQILLLRSQFGNVNHNIWSAQLMIFLEIPCMMFL